MAPTSTKQRRAIGIVRVSQVNGREGDSFASPAEQRDRIEAACERGGLTLLRIEDEANVGGGTPLERRDKLRRAVEGPNSRARFGEAARKRSARRRRVGRVRVVVGLVDQLCF